jgi:hypothetical protein
MSKKDRRTLPDEGADQTGRGLTLEVLCAEAKAFAEVESTYPEPSLYRRN